MGKLRFLLQCAAQMDYAALFRTVEQVHGVSGKGRAWLLADMLRCAALYGAGFNDYSLCALYDRTEAQRATYVTRGVNSAVIARLNDPAYYSFFASKTAFNRTFAPYLHRQYRVVAEETPEALLRFVEEQGQVMCKPDDAQCGEGVGKLEAGECATAAALADRLARENTGLLEEVIRQHPAMAALNPDAVNTVRVGTILTEGTPHVLYAAVRIGNSDRPVDNIHAGGMFAPVDLETGRISADAVDKARRVYAVHPRTGTPLRGFALPYWQAALDMCLEAARVVPQIGYVGWDVALAEDGPLLVEGNYLPGYDLLPQMPPHTPDGRGFKPAFQKYLPELK